MDPGAAAAPSLGLSPQRKPPPPTTTQPWSQLWLPGWCSGLMLMELLDVYTLEVTGYLLSGVPGKLFQGRGLTGSPVLWQCLRWVLGGQHCLRWVLGDSPGPGQRGGAARTAGQARPEVSARSPAQHLSDLY